jgi:hypothetical protein
MSTAPPTAPMVRHALGLPAGSVRALLTLIIVGLVCALMLMSRGTERVIPIPAYLFYLLFLALGHYFAARRGEIRPPGESNPLHLPKGCVRLLIVAALGATVTYKVMTDREGLEEQFRQSVVAIQYQPMLPVIVLAGFIVGVVIGAVVGQRRAGWAQDLQAWFSLIAVTMMCVAVLIHLVIDPPLAQRWEMPHWEGFLTAVVSFYFGERS